MRFLSADVVHFGEIFPPGKPVWGEKDLSNQRVEAQLRGLLLELQFFHLQLVRLRVEPALPPRLLLLQRLRLLLLLLLHLEERPVLSLIHI